MRKMETSDDEEILQLLVSSDGLHIYFITEYMVLSCMSIMPLQFSNFCWKKGMSLCHMLTHAWIEHEFTFVRLQVLLHNPSHSIEPYYRAHYGRATC